MQATQDKLVPGRAEEKERFTLQSVTGSTRLLCLLTYGGYAHGQSEWESVKVTWQIDIVIDCSLIQSNWTLDVWTVKTKK